MEETDLDLVAVVVPVNRIEAKEKILSVVDFDEDQTFQGHCGFEVQLDRSVRGGESFSTWKISRGVSDKVMLIIIDLMRQFCSEKKRSNRRRDRSCQSFTSVGQMKSSILFVSCRVLRSKDDERFIDMDGAKSFRSNSIQTVAHPSCKRRSNLRRKTVFLSPTRSCKESCSLSS